MLRIRPEVHAAATIAAPAATNGPTRSFERAAHA
nr:hypothetical protein [Pseudomonas sp. NFACC08-1]